MKKIKKLNIFGSQYIVMEVDDDELDDADGRCCFWDRTIYLAKYENWAEPDRTAYRKQVLRHEILHACLFESGLGYSSMKSEAWAMNEEMVDWFAIQGPKVLQIWEQAGCL